MKIVPVRLQPKQDLKKSCFAFLGEHKAGAIISVVGSLSIARLRLAGAKKILELPGPLEILSLSGTLSPTGAHLHISVADNMGQVTGGHLMDGCLIHTTAEILAVFLEDYAFARELDAETGYQELKITRQNSKN